MSDGPAEPRDVEAYCCECYRVEVVRYALPPTCPQCGARSPWRAVETQQAPFVLTENDRKMLKAFRIGVT